MLLNLAIATTTGEEVLRVVDGHVRHAAEEPVRYERVPGHVWLTAPLTEEFMPDWAVDQLRVFEPDFGSDGRIILLDMEVLEPGLVRVQGVWNDDPDNVIAITTQSPSFLRTDLVRPLAMMRAGVESVIAYTGPITSALFQRAERSPSADCE